MHRLNEITNGPCRSSSAQRSRADFLRISTRTLGKRIKNTAKEVDIECQFRRVDLERYVKPPENHGEKSVDVRRVG
jgi:hypothetical protein